MRHLPRGTVQRPQIVGKIGFEEAPELAGLGAGQDAGLRQASNGLRVHLQESGGFLEVQGVHWVGSGSLFHLVGRWGLPPEVGGGDLLAFVAEFTADGEPGGVVECLLRRGQLV